MSELLNRCVERLSSIVNLSTGLAHPLDESRAKELFIALHAAGEALEYCVVEDLALANKWPDRHAVSLAALAQRIGDGAGVMVEFPRNWGESTVAKIRAEIANST